MTTSKQSCATFLRSQAELQFTKEIVKSTNAQLLDRNLRNEGA
jgi:hypothetical protein